jgi:hypothetical protein
MLPKQVVSYGQLLSQGLRKNEVEAMSASLRLFPTPFKGIYYVPLETERKAWFIEKPLIVLSRSIEMFLKSRDFYYSCATAEEFWGIVWRPSGKIHVVNERRSLRLGIKERIERNRNKGTYRAKKIAKLLSFYGEEIVFHKGSVKGCKIKPTPNGRFASKSQIKKDRKRFRCE